MCGSYYAAGVGLPTGRTRRSGANHAAVSKAAFSADPSADLLHLTLSGHFPIVAQASASTSASAQRQAGSRQLRQNRGFDPEQNVRQRQQWPSTTSTTSSSRLPLKLGIGTPTAPLVSKAARSLRGYAAHDCAAQSTY